MNWITYFGAVLLALLALSLPALAHSQHRTLIREEWRHPLRLLFGVLHEELGVVVVTYCNQLQGTPGIVAPLAEQASQMPSQQVQVFFADADTQAVVVHNWGLPASAPTFLLPQVWLTGSLTGASQSSFTFGLTNTNTVTINKLSTAAGSGGTYNCYLRKGAGPYG